MCLMVLSLAKSRTGSMPLALQCLLWPVCSYPGAQRHTVELACPIEECFSWHICEHFPNEQALASSHSASSKPSMQSATPSQTRALSMHLLSPHLNLSGSLQPPEIRQACLVSSDPSAQSFDPSHTEFHKIQMLLSHLNLFRSHTQFLQVSGSSSLPSMQSCSPSHFH